MRVRPLVTLERETEEVVEVLSDVFTPISKNKSVKVTTDLYSQL